MLVRGGNDRKEKAAFMDAGGRTRIEFAGLRGDRGDRNVCREFGISGPRYQWRDRPKGAVRNDITPVALLGMSSCSGSSVIF